MESPECTDVASAWSRCTRAHRSATPTAGNYDWSQISFNRVPAMANAANFVQRRRVGPSEAPRGRPDGGRPAARAGVPRFLSAAPRQHAVNDVAFAGTRGAGESLPYLAQLDRAFGRDRDLSSVRAYVGEAPATACETLGAEAYASGSSVAFRSAPGLWLAAHEAAHVVQQRQGERPTDVLGAADDRLERQADAVADRVVAGGSARDLLPRGEPRVGAPAVQRYTVEDLPAGRARVGDGRQTALFGAQSLYAASGLIGGANAKLRSAGKKGSYIELTAAGGSVDVDGNALTEVQPKFLAKPGGAHGGVEKANAPGGLDTEGTANGPMALWTDCGRSSAAVTGSSGGGDRSVVYRENGVAKLGKGVDDSTVSDWLKGEPNRMANQVYMDLLPGFIARADNAAYVVEGVHWEMQGNAVTGALAGAAAGAGLGALVGSIFGGVGAGPGAVIGAVVGGIGGAIAGSQQKSKVFRKPATIAEAKMMYLALGNDGMDKFDKEAGINFYANPEIGESYSMATEGDMPGFTSYPGEKTWNYHWAGVVMKDGGDNITLEAYAVTKEYAASKGVSSWDFIDRDWTFAMYGTADKSQTFHQQHLASKTHGTHATSIAVRTDT